MCAYLLKPERKKHGWLYRLFERGFDALLNVYEAGLKIVLRHGGCGRRAFYAQ
jgi:multidrug efflux pump subunit AcrB